MQTTSRSTITRAALVSLALVACGPETPGPIVPEIPASILLSGTSVQFQLVEGDPAPDPAELMIENGGEVDLTGLSVQTSYTGAVADWLAVELSSTSAPASVVVRLRTENLEVGTWEARLSVLANGAENSPQDVSVQVVVESPPPPRPATVELSVSSVSLVASEVPDAPVSSAVEITNGGEAPLSGLAVGIEFADPEVEGWLSASLSETTAPATLEVVADGSALRPGVVSASIVLSADGLDDIRLPVDLEIQPRPGYLRLGSSSLDLDIERGSAGPHVYLVDVINDSIGSLVGLGVTASYEDGAPSGWLEVGIVNDGASVHIEPLVDQMSRGTYGATVEISAENSAESATLIVTLVVTEPAAIVLSANEARFEAPEASGATSPILITIDNDGDDPLVDLGVATEYREGERGGWLEATLSDTNAPATLELLAQVDTMRPGTYSADVIVSGEGVAEQRITVVLEVEPRPAHLRLASTSIDLEVTRGAPNPPVQRIEIFNDSIGHLINVNANVSYSDPGIEPWLGAYIYDNDRGVSLSVGVHSSLLDAGTYTADIEVSAENAMNEPAVVAVTLVVSEAAPFLNLSTGNIYVEAEYGSTVEPIEISVHNLSVGTINDLQATVTPRAGSEGDWVSTSLESTTAPTTLWLNIDIDGLNAGSYYADLSVSSPDAPNGPVTRRVTLVVTGGIADLTLIGTPPEPQTVLPGGTFEFPAYTIANIGTRQSEWDFNVGLYLSEDPELTAGDTFWGQGGWSWLAPGAEITRPAWTYRLPEDTAPGTYTFGLIVDHDEQIVESDETNNTLGIVLIVPSG